MSPTGVTFLIKTTQVSLLELEVACTHNQEPFDLGCPSQRIFERKRDTLVGQADEAVAHRKGSKASFPPS